MSMDALYFVLSIVGIGLVMRWLIANDRISPDKPTSGLLAMDNEATSHKQQSRDRRLGLPSDPGAHTARIHKRI